VIALAIPNHLLLRGWLRMKMTTMTKEWKEVPQVMFFSWSAKAQWTYLAKRDLNSAELALEHRDLKSAKWYRERAETYMDEAKDAKEG
jgi:hypothetical protein